MTHPELHLDRLDAVVFGLGQIVTDATTLHRRAWTATFDALLRSTGAGARRALTRSDHDLLADESSGLDAVRAVLGAHGVDLPTGSPADPSGPLSAWGIVNTADDRFVELLASEHPRALASSVGLLRRVRDAGAMTGLVTTCHHCQEILDAAGVRELFDAVVDAPAVAAMTLAAPPAPDTLVEVLTRLGAPAARAAFFASTVAEVAAGTRAGFAAVIALDRHGDLEQMVDAGAQSGAKDLAEVRLRGPGPAADPWHLQEDESDPGREGIRETLFTLGNGYLATRGARTYVVADATTHYPGTYIAGVYDRATGRVGRKPLEREALVNVPNWLPFSFAFDGGPAPGEAGATIRDSWTRLDLRRGLLERRYKVVVGDRVTSVLERRIVSMASPHLAALEVTLVAQNWSGAVELRSGIDGSVADTETIEERLLANRHLEVVDGGEDAPDLTWLTARTLQSHVTIAHAARTRLRAGEKSRAFLFAHGRATHVLVGHLEAGGRLTCEKVVATYTSRDVAISEPLDAARSAASHAATFASLLEAHERAWAELWRRGAIGLGGRRVDVRRLVNLHRFHLLQVASPHVADLDAGLGSRGLHGEGYLGHVFWDEVFVLPVLDLQFPEIARELLSYRSRRLDQARLAARSTGHDGAMYPWQSGSDGRDETPTTLYNPLSGRWMPDRSGYQRHVGLAVAFNYWQYWQATGDVEHLLHHGAEVLIEIARYFSSLAVFDAELGRHRIKGVIGPDEFHDGYPGRAAPGVDDNAYTNVMAAWLFTRVCELADLLERHGGTAERLGWDARERGRFEDLTRTLYVPFSDGVIEQFDGYRKLEPIDLDAYRARYGNIGRLDLVLEAEGDTVRRYQVAKQADVLMLLYLFSAEELRAVLGRLGYELSADTILRTVAFYSSRVTHGSSLSRVVHAWVAARTDRHASWRHFMEALSLDIHDSQGGTTREGIHLGGMAGTIDLLTRCYSGLEVRSDALWLNPRLPRELGRLDFSVEYRGHLLDLGMDHREVRVNAADGPASPATVVVRGRPYTLGRGEGFRHQLD